jgi:hypothetical protein
MLTELSVVEQTMSGVWLRRISVTVLRSRTRTPWKAPWFMNAPSHAARWSALVRRAPPG